MNIIIYDNSNLDMLNPFSINHSPIELRLGAFTNYDRIKNVFGNKHNYIIIVRDEIEDLIKEKFSQDIVNPEIIPEGICINSLAIIFDYNIDAINRKDSLSSSGKLISFYLNKEILKNKFNDLINEKSAVTIESDIKVINNIWEILDFPQYTLDSDYNNFLYTNNYNWHPSLIKINEEKVYLGDSCNIKAGVILDASNGPIIIDKNAVISHHVSIEGPVYVGRNAFISSGSRIKENTIIGPYCKIGGEVSNCNFLGYSNKVHEGFLGHSYIGEWVNIGAGTNNSNLKNNYSNVKIKMRNSIYDTQKQFIGSFIGDYTRISIGTVLNTGTLIDIGSNLFNHQFDCKYISSFSWGMKEKVDFDKFLESISKMKERRSKELLVAEIELLKKLYNDN